MAGKLKSLVNILWLKARHPTVKTRGMHYIRLGTEIVLLNNGKLEIGNKVATQRRVVLSVVGGEMTIGNNTSFNRNDILICHAKINIGKNCSFGPNVCIYDHDHRYDRNGHEKTKYKTSPIIIDDNCWIGANVTILRGTHIGEGCVIGAGAIIKGDIPAHSLVTSDRKIVIRPIEER